MEIENPDLHGKPPEEANNDNEHVRRQLNQTAVLILLLLSIMLLVALPIGVCLGVDEDCETENKYEVTLEINESSPVIQTSNHSSVWGGGLSSTTTWVIGTKNNGYHTTFAHTYGWIDKALRVDYVDEYNDAMSVRILFNNRLSALERMYYILPPEDTTDPVCDPETTSEKIYFDIGAASEEFELGHCRLPRLDDTNLQPRLIDIGFSGKVYAEKV